MPPGYAPLAQALRRAHDAALRPSPPWQRPDVVLRGEAPSADCAALLQAVHCEGRVAAAGQLTALLQYDSPGFVHNRRQHRQFGLAVLAVASAASIEWGVSGRQSAAATDGRLRVRRCCCSNARARNGGGGRARGVEALPAGGSADGGRPGRGSDVQAVGGEGRDVATASTCALGYREFFDMAVRWRQAC